MNGEETAAAVKDAVGSLGGAFMLSAETLERGRELGYRPWAFYYGGRGGVLGDVDADVVAAAFAFMPPALIRKSWEEARGIAAPDITTRLYAECAHQWGRAHLDGVDGLDRLVWLAQRVVDAAPVVASPLMAGWRALELPEDLPAQAAQLLHVLREHRGAMHLVAVLATGLTPLEAVVAGAAGPGTAKFFGWPGPYPDPEPLLGRYEAAEALTDELAAAPYDALDEGERDELADLLGKAAVAAR